MTRTSVNQSPVMQRKYVVAAAYLSPTSSAQASHFRASSVHHRATASCHQPHLPPQAATPPSLTLQRIHALRHRNTHPSIAPPSPHVYPRPSNPHRQNGCYVHYRRPPGRIARRTSARSPSCRGGKVRITVLEVPCRSYSACVEASAGNTPYQRGRWPSFVQQLWSPGFQDIRAFLNCPSRLPSTVAIGSPQLQMSKKCTC